MNKRILVILAASAMVVSSLGLSVGCAKKSIATTETTPVVETTAVTVKPVAHIEEEPQAAEPDDTQNPVMNYVGNYFYEKNTLQIEADGSENAKLTFVIPVNDNQKTVITVNAKFNAITGSVAYVNGTKKEVTLNCDGSNSSEKEIYSNGTGVLVFGNGGINWNDETEKIENMLFVPGIPDDISFDYQKIDQSTKAKKAKKTSKKTAKKTSAKTTVKQTVQTATAPAKKPGFSYGKSAFKAKNMAVYVTINKDNSVKVSITRSPIDTDDDYYEVSHLWSFTGKIDPETGVVSYTNGCRMYFVNSVSFNQSRCMYLNGKGEIKIKGNTLKWKDFTEHYADGIIFTKV